jgi:hypothetical protein
MKVTKTTAKQVKEEEVVEVICDWCKEPFKKEFVECSGYGVIEASFGFPSAFDGTDFDGEICDECFKKHILPHLRARDVN